jgi:broad specificity phosphatase PhoE
MIYLVRHGETEWNLERRMQGRRESKLTPLGRRQAAAMARLIGELIAREPQAEWRLVSSPLGRARETAQAIADRLDVTIEIDERVSEIAFGDWEGRLRDEVAPQHPEMFASREWLVSPPGGETFEDVWTRISAFMADLAPEPERRVIVVSHGMAGRVLRGVYAGLSRQQTLDQDVPQDAVYRLMDGQIDRFDCEPVEEG